MGALDAFRFWRRADFHPEFAQHRLRFDRDRLPAGRTRRFHWREQERAELMQLGGVSGGAEMYDPDPRIKQLIALRGGLTIPVFSDEDVTLMAWDWPLRTPNWGEGRYVFRDGHWVRP